MSGRLANDVAQGLNLLSVNKSEQASADVQKIISNFISDDFAVVVAGAAGRAIFLTCKDGQAFDLAMNNAIAKCRAIALSSRGRGPTIHVPPGSYVMSATNSTITIEPWMKVKTQGNARVVVTGHTVPVFWVRNDVTPTFNQGTDSENNSGNIFDGTNGALVIEGNRSTGGAGIRYGNFDGVWGSPAYAGATLLTFLCRTQGVAIVGMDNGLQFTNNSAFCLRFTDVRVTGCNKGLTTSTGAAFNAFEISTFTDCFFNNQYVLNLEFNSRHQISMSGTSLTFCRGGNIDFNSDRARLHLQNGRIEGGDYISKSSGDFKRTILQMVNETIIPTTNEPSEEPHYREFFSGKHVVQMTNISFELENSSLAPDWIAPASLYLAGPDVEVQWDNVRAIGDYRQPMPSRKSLVPNARMDANITGWTKLSAGGTIAHSTAQANSGAGSMRCSISAGQLRVQSPLFPVQAGKPYTAIAAIMLAESPTPTTPFYLNIRLNWFAADGVTSLGTSTYQAGSNLALKLGEWQIHSEGTRLCEAPDGAAFAAVEIATNNPHTGDFWVDDVMAQRL